MKQLQLVVRPGTCRFTCGDRDTQSLYLLVLLFSLPLPIIAHFLSGSVYSGPPVFPSPSHHCTFPVWFCVRWSSCFLFPFPSLHISCLVLCTVVLLFSFPLSIIAHFLSGSVYSGRPVFSSPSHHCKFPVWFCVQWPSCFLFPFPSLHISCLVLCTVVVLFSLPLPIIAHFLSGSVYSGPSVFPSPSRHCKFLVWFCVQWFSCLPFPFPSLQISCLGLCTVVVLFSLPLPIIAHFLPGSVYSGRPVFPSPSHHCTIPVWFCVQWSFCFPFPFPSLHISCLVLCTVVVLFSLPLPIIAHFLSGSVYSGRPVFPSPSHHCTFPVWFCVQWSFCFPFPFPSLHISCLALCTVVLLFSLPLPIIANFLSGSVYSGRPVYPSPSHHCKFPVWFCVQWSSCFPFPFPSLQISCLVLCTVVLPFSFPLPIIANFLSISVYSGPPVYPSPSHHCKVPVWFCVQWSSCLPFLFPSLQISCLVLCTVVLLFTLPLPIIANFLPGSVYSGRPVYPSPSHHCKFPVWFCVQWSSCFPFPFPSLQISCLVLCTVVVLFSLPLPIIANFLPGSVYSGRPVFSSPSHHCKFPAWFCVQWSSCLPFPFPSLQISCLVLCTVVVLFTLPLPIIANFLPGSVYSGRPVYPSPSHHCKFPVWFCVQWFSCFPFPFPSLQISCLVLCTVVVLFFLPLPIIANFLPGSVYSGRPVYPSPSHHCKFPVWLCVQWSSCFLFPFPSLQISCLVLCTVVLLFTLPLPIIANFLPGSVYSGRPVYPSPSHHCKFPVWFCVQWSSCFPFPFPSLQISCLVLCTVVVLFFLPLPIIANFLPGSVYSGRPVYPSPSHHCKFPVWFCVQWSSCFPFPFPSLQNSCLVLCTVVLLVFPSPSHDCKFPVWFCVQWLFCFPFPFPSLQISCLVLCTVVVLFTLPLPIIANYLSGSVYSGRPVYPSPSHHCKFPVWFCVQWSSCFPFPFPSLQNSCLVLCTVVLLVFPSPSHDCKFPVWFCVQWLFCFPFPFPSLQISCLVLCTVVLPFSFPVPIIANFLSGSVYSGSPVFPSPSHHCKFPVWFCVQWSISGKPCRINTRN